MKAVTAEKEDAGPEALTETETEPEINASEGAPQTERQDSDGNKAAEADSGEEDNAISEVFTEAKPDTIVTPSTYQTDWRDFNGNKAVDTTGSASLILKGDGSLWYFGSESVTPVNIMDDVKSFSLADESDTLGYTAPAALILTNDGRLYGCGCNIYRCFDGISEDQENFPEDIPFLEPVFLRDQVKDCLRSWRACVFSTEDGELYRFGDAFYILEEDFENPIEETQESEDAYMTSSQNYSFVLSDTVQMGSGRSFYLSVLKDGSVWSCYLPADDDDRLYAEGYGEVMGDGSSELVEKTPVCVFEAGTCRID